MARPTVYEIIYMLPGGEVVIRKKDEPPQPRSLYFYRPKTAVFVCRYYPMFKIWRVFDLRQFEVYLKNGYQTVRVPGHIHFTDRNAAVMWMGLNV